MRQETSKTAEFDVIKKKRREPREKDDTLKL
jgi:hypothetical protein